MREGVTNKGGGDRAEGKNSQSKVKQFSQNFNTFLSAMNLCNLTTQISKEFM